MWHYVITENYDVLSENERQENAREFYSYFSSTMTLEAICGILGNIDRESQLNPGQQEGGYGGSLNYGYGLIQWTPGSLLVNWANNNNLNWYDGSAQCRYIDEEGNYTGQDVVWIPTSQYPFTWSQYKQITNIDTATKAYLFERERAGVVALNERLQAARYWYNYLTGIIGTFVPRLNTDGMAGSQWYYSIGNWYYANGYSPPNIYGNCTWYAYGRYAEIRQAFANLSTRNACYWFEYAQLNGFPVGDYSTGAMPALGAIICFQQANDPHSDTYPGHLTVVEQINNDGSIVVSQSGYSDSPSTYFWTATVDNTNQYREAWYTQDGRNYICQGFIYLGGYVPPTPHPTRRQKMPLWMMLKYGI